MRRKQAAAIAKGIDSIRLAQSNPPLFKRVSRTACRARNHVRTSSAHGRRWWVEWVSDELHTWRPTCRQRSVFRDLEPVMDFVDLGHGNDRCPQTLPERRDG